MGTGFLADAQGLVLTCAHVVKGREEVLVEFTLGTPQPPPRHLARVEKRYPEADLAGLRLPETPPGIAPLRLVKSEAVNLWGHDFRVFGFAEDSPCCRVMAMQVLRRPYAL